MTPRADALRSRERILDAARSLPVRDLRLNEVAAAAAVGVGTVYRHFPTVPALVEALNVDALDALVARARRASESDDAAAAFDGLVRDAVALLVEHEGLQDLLVAPPTTTPVADAVGALRAAVEATLAAARDAGSVRADLTVDHVQRLVCGVDHAVRLGHGTDRALLLDVVLAGLRPSAAR